MKAECPPACRGTIHMHDTRRCIQCGAKANPSITSNDGRRVKAFCSELCKETFEHRDARTEAGKTDARVYE